ncbi:hypothetical protein D3C72_2213520 [compost metagenome]
MKNISRVGGEPFTPLRLTGHVLVEEIDVGSPGSVAAVDDRFQAHFQVQRTGFGNRPFQFIVRYCRFVAKGYDCRLGLGLNRRESDCRPVGASQ